MDCLKGMEEMVKQNIKVDAVICDPPQEITQNDWDRSIPFEKMWELLYELRKYKKMPIILFTNQPFTTDLINSNRKDFKYMKYWHKDRPTNFLNARRQPLRDIEEIAVFYEKQCTYNPQFWKGKPLHGTGNKYKYKKGINNNYGEYDCRSKVRNARKGSTQKYPRQLMRYQRPHPSIHPTEKPVELLEDLIKTFTNKNDLILDFTMGSGTTAVACINTNRNYIGFEIEKKYCDIAIKRIEAL